MSASIATVASREDYDGFTTSPSVAVAGVVLFAMASTILLASALDFFVVVPELTGRSGGLPIWASDPLAQNHHRRQSLTQIWLVGRSIAHVVALIGAATLAGLLVAWVSSLPNDEHLQTVVATLGGAAIALVLFRQPFARLAGALRFALTAPVAIGSWVEGVDETGRRVEGMVIDVSIAPGIKLVDTTGKRTFVPLDSALTLHEAPRPVSDAHAQELFASHFPFGVVPEVETADRSTPGWSPKHLATSRIEFQATADLTAREIAELCEQ